MTTAAQQGAYGVPFGYNFGNSGPSCQLDFTRALFQKITLNNACVLDNPINPPPIGVSLILLFTQDGTGSRNLTYSSAWRNAPALGASGAAGATALLEFMYDGANYQFMGGATAWVAQAAAVVPGAGGALYAGSQPSIGRAPIVPTIGAVTLAGAAPAVERNKTFLVPGPGGLLVNGQYPSPTRP